MTCCACWRASATGPPGTGNGGAVGAISGDGQLFIQPVPECAVHGQMHLNMAKDRWECPGFDGEGCGRVVTMEELERSWVPLGTVDPDGFQ